MDVNKRNFFKKRPNNQFKRKGSSIKKTKWHNSSREQYLGNSHPADTVYRILCPSRKIGGVIGKGGGIVKSLREETKAKITVADSVPGSGSDERVIIIYSSPTKISRKQSSDEDSAVETEKESIELHCAAQDALLKVHDRIVEEDLFGGMASDDDNENDAVTARLLVPNNMVGCLLGKRGDVIQRLRSETGANIRILPADCLPACAMDTDELVQISGKPDVAKRALYEVSTLLHQNPRKDKPPSSFPGTYGGQSFHPPGAPPMTSMHSPGNSMWPSRNSSSHGMPPMPWMGGYGNQPSGFGSGGFNGAPPGHGGESSAEFSMKILCSAGKIGGVIGKGGFNVKQLQQETGTSIHVEDASTESDERVIRVSSFEGLWNPRSQTIDAILQLQNKTSDFSEKGTIVTRLLVPSSKVGCILGQGGHVINEMRRRTQADIRVCSKDDRPKCASEEEELVQISGNVAVAKDALVEIATRLRVRTLRDIGVEPAPAGPIQRFGVVGSLPGRGPLLSATVGVGSSGVRGGHDYDPPSYTVPPSATGYPNMNSALEARIPNNAVGPPMGTGGNNISNVGEVAAPRVKLQDPQSGGPDIRGSSEHLTGAHSILQAFMNSAGHNMNAQQGSYQNMNAQKSCYQSMSAQQSTYHSMNAPQSSYHNMNAQQNSCQNINLHQSPYHSLNAQQSPYQSINAQQSPYSMTAQQGVYPNITAPQSAYHNIGGQQGAYQC